MSKHEEADLILKLYDLRREPTMRIARDYFFRDFNPESMADIGNLLMGEHSGHIRMVMSYWDMAAALVNHGAIDIKQRAAVWRQSGWKGFDPEAKPYTADELSRERELIRKSHA